MEEFKGNSNASKIIMQTDSLEKQKIDPITTDVTVKKQSEIKKFGKQFFTEDAKSVGDHIISNVFIPSIQKLLSDVVKNGIDWLIYGSKGSSQTQSGIRNVSYSNYYQSRSQTTQTIPQSAYRQNNIYAINDIVFNDRGEAEEVLLRLREEVERYGMTCVGDFYDMIGQKYSYTDQKYGWRDLREAEVIRVRDGYSIKFPRVTPLE